MPFGASSLVSLGAHSEYEGGDDKSAGVCSMSIGTEYRVGKGDEILRQ